ncbi:MAG: hypothetical protein EBU28_05655 [Gammaproteobacteria bacterium]|nr:hypothetical protein [Gammaproteobacteria bacterium]
MSKIRHPNLIGVTEYFEANDTLYMVMKHEAGRDLRWFISKMAGTLDWDFLQRVFPPIGDGLMQMHEQGVVHLDIKPANILLRTSGQPLLLDFGAAQALDNDKPFGSFQTLTHGFAPPEQYLDGELGSWTDIYGFAATMYNCMTGNPPPAALKRREGEPLEKITVTRADRYPYTLLRTIDFSHSRLARAPAKRRRNSKYPRVFGACSVLTRQIQSVINLVCWSYHEIQRHGGRAG